MVYIRGARFSMGRDHDQLVPDERPAHAVDLRDFAIGTTEVTFAEFNRFARATNRPLPDDMEWGRGQRLREIRESQTTEFNGAGGGIRTHDLLITNHYSVGCKVLQRDAQDCNKGT